MCVFGLLMMSLKRRFMTIILWMHADEPEHFISFIVPFFTTSDFKVESQCEGTLCNAY